MKTRNGFVSNSSSSSFIVIIPEDKYEGWKNNLSKLEKEILDEVGEIDFRTILGVKATTISRSMGNDEGMFEYCDMDEEDIDPYEIWENMMKNLPESSVEINI